MNKIIIFLAFQSLTVFNISAQDKYIADTAQTKLLWLGDKVTGQHTGTIKLQSGWLTWKDNKITSGEFKIDMSSIKESQNTEKLISHLKSDDFFSVDKFPLSTIVITGSTPFDKGNGVVTGNLTIKGITNPIEFKAALKKEDNGIWFYSNITIDRTKYNIRYGSGTFFDNLGDKTVFDEFKLKVSILVKETN